MVIEDRFMSERVSYKEMVELYNQGFNRLENKIDEMKSDVNKLKDKVEQVHIQATITNGRVTACENTNADVREKLKKIESKMWAIGLRVGIGAVAIMFLFYLVTGQTVALF